LLAQLFRRFRGGLNLLSQRVWLNELEEEPRGEFRKSTFVNPCWILFLIEEQGTPINEWWSFWEGQSIKHFANQHS
jgi:hypothetical protein